MTNQKKVLAVLRDAELAARFDGLFQRSSIRVNRVRSGAGALVLAGNVRYDLLVVELPLVDLALREFVHSLRTLESTCESSALMLLEDPARTDERRRAHEDELSRVVSKRAREQELLGTISHLLGVAERRSVRILVHAEVELEEGRAQRLFQSHNLSESGMLLRGGQLLPVGLTFRFQLTLPDDARPVEGEARVVRHTTRGEEVTGIAVTFERLEPGSEALLHNYVERLGSAKSRPPAAAAGI